MCYDVRANRHEVLEWKKKKVLHNAISKKRWEAMGFSWLERASVEAKPRRCFTRMRSQVRVLLSPPKKKTTPKGVVFLFWWKQDSNLFKCKAPVEPCSLRAGPQRHHNFIESCCLHRPKGGRLGGFAMGWCGDGRFSCDNPSVSFADSCLRATRSRLWLSTGQPFTTATALRLPFTQGSLGALPRQRKALGAEEDGRFLRCFAATPHQSPSVTASPQGEALARRMSEGVLQFVICN